MSNEERQKGSNRADTLLTEVNPWVNKGDADLLISKKKTESPIFNENVMEEICERSNLEAAMKRVKSNAGSPGVDDMNVEELAEYLKRNWPQMKKQLLEGKYCPKPVKRVEIPKPGSREKRKLGIPCVVDRFIQQAVLQILQNKWDREFSNSSYGFRPGKRAHQAISQAQSYIKQGYGWVVDIDLEKFFDRVNHDRLMSVLAKEIKDKRVLKLIRSFLNAGIMENGLVTTPDEGTPQGGSLSPFLSNVVLDELDKELEIRGHKFARYADDCNIYVKSKRAGERVMKSISSFITRRLKLKVNASKSAVALPRERKFLGFTFTYGKNPNRRKISAQSLKRFKIRVHQLTNRNWSISFEQRIERLTEYLRGWKGYFGFCETPSVLYHLDCWIRRRLRCVLWKEWKTYQCRKRELIKRGVCYDNAHLTAWSSKGQWKMSHTPSVQQALPISYFDFIGLPRLCFLKDI
jgi:RNA-directed DNA polymerase